MLNNTTKQPCGYVITALVQTLQAKINPSLWAIKDTGHNAKTTEWFCRTRRYGNIYVNLLLYADNSLDLKQK